MNSIPMARNYNCTLCGCSVFPAPSHPVSNASIYHFGWMSEFRGRKLHVYTLLCCSGFVSVRS
jgi:hypothetical protein